MNEKDPRPAPPVDAEAVPLGTAERPAVQPSAVQPSALQPRGNRWLAVALSWLLPGLGHAYLGRWRRGLAFALLVGLLIFVGVTLRGPLWGFAVGVPGLAGVSIPVNSQILALPLVVVGLSGFQGVVSHQGYEYGLTFLLTASLFSLLLMLDAWDISRGYKP